MPLLVDTSVWSLALRRDTPSAAPEVTALRRALAGDNIIVTTGLILQELLQGFVPERSRQMIIDHFAHVPLVRPNRDDHISAAAIRNTCRHHGVQIGTVDALIAQLAIRHDLMLLSTDLDFHHAATHVPLHLWQA